MKRLAGLTIAAVLLSGAAVVWAQGDPKLVDAGKKLYDANKCSQCHTIAGKGGTLTKLYPLHGVAAKPVADIKKWLTAPAEMEAKLEKKPTMTMSSKKYAFKDAEVDALVAYMLTLKK